MVFVMSLRSLGTELNQFCLPPILKSTDTPLLCRNILSLLHLLNQSDVQLSCMSLCVIRIVYTQLSVVSFDILNIMETW